MASGSRVSVYTIGGTILIFISLGLIIFAEAFPWWLQSEKTRDTGIPHVGLWEFCFREDGYPAPWWSGDTLGNRYYGCNYVFDRDLRFILDWMFPGWFIVVTLFVTLGLLMMPLAIIFNIMYYVRVCSAHSEHILLLVSSLLNGINGFLTAIAIMVFGIKSGTDGKWVPMPNSNHLSYSFGVCAIVPVLCFIAGSFHAVDFLRMKSFKDRDARAKVYARGEFARY